MSGLLREKVVEVEEVWHEMGHSVRLKDFLVVLAATASILGIIFVGAVLLLGQSWVDQYRLYLFTHGVYWLLLPPLVWSVRRKSDDGQFRSPRIRKVLDGGIILVENVSWMGIGIGVSVYREIDGYEQLICEGVVRNIQSNGLIQIETAASVNNNYVSEMKLGAKELIIKPGQSK